MICPPPNSVDAPIVAIGEVFRRGALRPFATLYTLRWPGQYDGSCTSLGELRTMVTRRLQDRGVSYQQASKLARRALSKMPRTFGEHALEVSS